MWYSFVNYVITNWPKDTKFRVNIPLRKVMSKLRSKASINKHFNLHSNKLHLIALLSWGY